MSKTPEYINVRPVVNRGAIINFILTLRNKGKTTIFLKRAYRRFVKRGYATYWVRRTEDERKKAQMRLVTPQKCRIIGASPDDFRQKGDTLFCKRRGKWAPFLTFLAVSAYRDERSADDDRYHDMVFDEYQTTPASYRRYVGNEAQDFFDLFVSKKRNHKMQVWMLGNKEGYTNPYHRFFGVPDVRDDMPDGITTYHDGAVCLCVDMSPAPFPQNAYERKLSALVKKTAAGGYMYDGLTKGSFVARVAPLPRQKRIWASVDCGTPVTIYATADGFAVGTYVRDGRKVFCGDIHIAARYSRSIVILPEIRKRFSPLVAAVKNGRVTFQTAAVAEYSIAFFKKIGIPV